MADRADGVAAMQMDAAPEKDARRPVGARRMLQRALADSQVALEQARAEQAETHALYRIVSEYASDIIVRIDSAWNRVFVSPSCREVLGYEQQELLGRGAFDLVHPEDLQRVRAVLTSIGPQHPASDATWRARRKDGSYVWIEARYRHVAEDGGLVAVLRDVTRRKLAEDRLAETRTRLERLAMMDSLTGLPNRRCFIETADKLLTGPQPFALLFIDLDGFKPINDVHGHKVGDAILQQVSTRLKAELPAAAIVARLGGDEFAVLLDADDGDPLIAAQARDIIRAVSVPVRVEGMTLDLGATIGISVNPRNGTDSAALLRTADIAMAYAKRTGGGNYRFFEQWMGDEVARAADLKNELRHAIEAHELLPYFQPLVRLADTTIVGFEVLARWEHPQRGLLSPAQFLPLVEEMNLSREMFEVMLTRACTTAQAWPRKVMLSVNLSARELQDETLPDRVNEILRRTDFDGARLELEITENALIHDSKVARGVLDGLRAQGMTVALDDFGTGFSSLYHLRELPFDKLKIDKSFMQALTTDPDSARYVAAIVGLGQALGLELTAEGIEDAETMRHLNRLGCHYGQGYLFGAPQPAEQASSLLRSRTLQIEIAQPPEEEPVRERSMSATMADPFTGSAQTPRRQI